MTRIFLYLISLSASIKRAAWKLWYQRLAGYYEKSDWRFMNYGYEPLEGGSFLALSSEDEENRLHIQLYQHILDKLDLTNMQVLEIGSGRGGGCDYVARALRPGKIIGVDYSKNAVKLCRRFYKQPNLVFEVGNAEELPFDSNVFDLVYNVESSHCYGNMKAFVSEVVRVLKPGGLFCWTDLRPIEEMEVVEQIFKDSPLKILFKEEITPNVLKALEMNSEMKEEAIRAKAPKWIVPSFLEFAGVKNSKIFQAFCAGRAQYWHYRLQLKD